MSEVIRIEIREDQHGFIGLGKIIYEYDVWMNDIRITVANGSPFHLDESSKNRAKNMFTEDDNNESKINDFKQFAANCCEIPIFRLYEKTKKEEIVFARYITMWYANKVLGYSLDKTGSLFDKDHATVLHGNKIIDSFYWDINNIKYLKEKQKRWAITFMNKIKIYIPKK